MRLFVNSDSYPAYRRQFDEEWGHLDTFAARRRAFLNDRYSAVHFLKPVLDGEEWAFFTNGDDEVLQRMWAREHGMARTRDISTILLAQIEEHRTEVFYNHDPTHAEDQTRRVQRSNSLTKAVRHQLSARSDATERKAVPLRHLGRQIDQLVGRRPA